VSRKRKHTKYQVRLADILKLIGVLAIFGVLIVGNQQKKSAQIDKIHVRIQPLPNQKFLINAKDVYSIISQISSFDIERARVRDFDFRTIESRLLKDPRVKYAIVYVNKKNELQIQIEQRNPIVRIDVSDDKNENNYYLDEDGFQIPIYKKRLIRVPVATGMIDPFEEDFKNKLNNSLAHVHDLSKSIYQDQFLSSLVEQIHVDLNGDLLIIPKIGRSKIIIGDASEMNAKLDKLKDYYKEGIQIKGIETYAELDLSWEGQIVGRK